MSYSTKHFHLPTRHWQTKTTNRMVDLNLTYCLLPLVDPDGGTELLEGIVLTDEEPGPSEELLGIKITVRSKEKYCKTCRNLPSIKTFWEVHPKTDI